jgi:hypothetical protein
LLTRPELIRPEPDVEAIAEGDIAGARDRRLLPAAFAGLGVALAVAVFLSPWASDLPDGLEFVGAKTGILNDTSESSRIPAPLAGYQLPLPGLRDLKAATAIVGVVGTLAVFGLSWGLARVLGSGGRPERVPADAA